MHIGACEVLLQSTKDQGDRFALEKLLVQGEASTADLAKFVESVCGRQPPWRILQFLCLWSIVESGIPSKYYRQFHAAFLRAYGYEFLPALQELRRKGLLEEKHGTAVNALHALIGTTTLSGAGGGASRMNAAATTSPFKIANFSTVAAALKLCPTNAGIGVDKPNIADAKQKLNLWSVGRKYAQNSNSLSF